MTARPAARTTDLLIVGAGPFGLGLAAYADSLGIDHLVVGEPMGFWKHNMPAGMYLRSTCNWSLDPLGVHTIDAFLEESGSSCGEVEPLSRDFYLDYGAWFQEKKGIRSIDTRVERLDMPGAGGRMQAALDDGTEIAARAVVLALGFRDFASTPAEVVKLLPSERVGHTCELVAPDEFRGQRVLIVGGRQSALEWTALLREAGAEAVHVSHRHDTPAFAPSDWRWVDEMVERIAREPGWFHRLDAAGQEAIAQRFWAEGRLKLEPWLAPRVSKPNVHIWPRTRIVGSDEAAGSLRVRFDTGQSVDVDRVVFATGYRMDVGRIPFLSADGVVSRNGYPALGDHFETSVPGLYMTSLAAVQDFGPFMAFTVSVRSASRVIGDHVQQFLIEDA